MSVRAVTKHKLHVMSPVLQRGTTNQSLEPVNLQPIINQPGYLEQTEDVRIQTQHQVDIASKLPHSGCTLG